MDSFGPFEIASMSTAAAVELAIHLKRFVVFGCLEAWPHKYIYYSDIYLCSTGYAPQLHERLIRHSITLVFPDHTSIDLDYLDIHETEDTEIFTTGIFPN